MNQRTYSWIGIRAIALLEEKNEEKNLVRLLKPHAREASEGLAHFTLTAQQKYQNICRKE